MSIIDQVFSASAARCDCASTHIVGLKAACQEQMMHQHANICEFDPGRHLAASIMGPLISASFLLGPTLVHVPKLTTAFVTPFAKLHVLALRHACSGPSFDECGCEKPDLYRFVVCSARRGTMLPEVLPIKFVWVGLSYASKAKVRHL
jgi:hypothetical protein